MVRPCFTNSDDDSEDGNNSNEPSGNPTPCSLDLAKEGCEARKRSMDIIEEYFTGRDGDVKEKGRTETINLNMAIRRNPAFRGPYAKLREILQNAIDQLHLSSHGMRKSDVVIEAETDGPVTKISFVCAQQEMLKICVSENELFLYQSHTYPLEKATLQNPVEDPTKNDSSQAGGFGEGFKVAIRQWLYEKAQVSYVMTSEMEQISWNFGAKKPPARLSAYSSRDGLIVKCISKRRKSASRIRRTDEVSKNKSIWLHPNTLLVHVKQEGIAKDFFEGVVPRMAIFFDLQRSTIYGLETSTGESLPRLYEHNGDVIAEAVALKFHPAIQACVPNLLTQVAPMPGVYVLGLYVEECWLPKAAYFAGGASYCKIGGRDRNHVDLDDFKPALRTLLVGVFATEVQHFDRFTSDLNRGILDAGAYSWMSAKTDGFFKEVFARHGRDLKRILGFPENCAFVNTAVNDRFLIWGVEKCNSDSPGSIVEIDEDTGKHIFDRLSALSVKRTAVNSLADAESESAAACALALVCRICFEDVPMGGVGILLKHADSLDTDFTLEDGETKTIVLDSSQVTPETIQSFYRAMRESPDRARSNRMFREIYNLEDGDSYTDVILEALRRLTEEAGSEESVDDPVDESVEEPAEEPVEEESVEDGGNDGVDDDDSDDDSGEFLVDLDNSNFTTIHDPLPTRCLRQVYNYELGIYTPPDRNLPARTLLEERKAVATHAMELVSERVSGARLERVRLSWSPSADWSGLHSSNNDIYLNLALLETNAKYIVTLLHEIAHDFGHGHDLDWSRKLQELFEKIL
jgi:hypothetical protein